MTVSQCKESDIIDGSHLAIDSTAIRAYEKKQPKSRSGAQAIIALNRRDEKEPPAGRASDGTPRCSMGYDMVYWGTDGDRLKFHCLHA